MSEKRPTPVPGPRVYTAGAKCCCVCGRRLFQKAKEFPKAWEKRTTCDRFCAARLKSLRTQ
jgi:hypothetical protein